MVEGKQSAVRAQSPTLADRAASWEKAGYLTWFAMEGAWLFDLDLSVLYVFVAAAVGTNLSVFLFTERNVPALSVTSAENCWVLLNVFWLLSEYKPETEWFLTTAEIIFAFNVAFLAVAFASSRLRRGVSEELTVRLRRLRGDIRKGPDA